MNAATSATATAKTGPPSSALYVAPIKALLNNQADRLGAYTQMVGLRRFVWHGDTPSHERRSFLREPAELLMTTPESLEVMLISPRVDAAKLFGDLRVVVIDEIHALVGNKRGAHLALSLERLDHICGRKLQRIGLSATQKPIDEVWNTMMDLERVVPCVPGARVIEKTGDRAVRAEVKIKLGAMTMNYSGPAEIVDQDDSGHRAVMNARAKEAGGQGNADARVSMQLTGTGGATEVNLFALNILVNDDFDTGALSADVELTATPEASPLVLTVFASDPDGEPVSSLLADLSALQAISVTGSPLAVDAFAWVYEHVKRDLWVAAISGGTDLASGLVGGCALAPVRAGEIQCRWLGHDAWGQYDGLCSASTGGLKSTASSSRRSASHC